MLNPKKYLPNLTSDYEVSDLIENVSIFRDAWGIPHIRAAKQDDLFFAQGFVTAQDRLFQMDLDRLRSLGRSSEYLGSKAISSDKINIKRNFEAVSKSDLLNSSNKSKKMIKSFSKGVNFYLSKTKSLPFEYQLLKKRPDIWEDWHSVLVYKIRNAAEGSFSSKLFYSKLSSSIGSEKAAKLTPGYLPNSLLTVPPGKKYSGEIENAVLELKEAAKNFSAIGAIDGESNGWAISGKKTYSGSPIIGGDSHRALDTPNVYYQIHLKCKDFEGIGYTIPGYPGIMHFAHNKKVAWGMTHGGADTQDLFLEKLRFRDQKIQFFYKDKWINTKNIKTKIKPRNADEIEVDIIETNNGNIIFGNPKNGYGISLSDPGTNKVGTFWIDSAYEAMISNSADELEKAFDKWTDRTNNYPYADKNKQFGYKFAGMVPIRHKQHQWGIAKGWEEKYSIKGEIPRNKLPRIRNPKSNWVVTCNQKVVDYDYPYFMSIAFAPEYRAKVLIDYIKNQSEKLKIEHMLEMHNEIFSIPAKKIVSFSKKINLNNFSISTIELKSLKKLFTWNFLMDKNSIEPSIYSVTKENIVREIIKLNYGPFSTEIINYEDPGGVFHVRRFLLPLINEHIGDQNSFLLSKKINWDELFISSHKNAVRFLEKKFGSNINSWIWGKLHKTNHQHPLSSEFPDYSKILNPQKVGISGDGDTPFAGSYDKNFQVIAASVNRYTHDTSNWNNSRWIVPLGSSGNPGSINYSNQQKIWAKGETIPQLWDWDIIEKKSRLQKLSAR